METIWRLEVLILYRKRKKTHFYDFALYFITGRSYNFALSLKSSKPLGNLANILRMFPFDLDLVSGDRVHDWSHLGG